MLRKEEIEICKEECRNYIKFMDTAGDNAGWARGLMWYIEELEAKVKELSKGQHSLMQSRKKWKNRYYKESAKRKELIEKLGEDIKILNSEERITPELVHKAVEAVYAQKLLAILKGEKEVCN